MKAKGRGGVAVAVIVVSIAVRGHSRGTYVKIMERTPPPAPARACATLSFCGMTGFEAMASFRSVPFCSALRDFVLVVLCRVVATVLLR